MQLVDVAPMRPTGQALHKGSGASANPRPSRPSDRDWRDDLLDDL
jgi:hypothetical protein